MDKSEIQQVKMRFGIIGNAENLNRAINVAIQVATTDLTVLITDESGVGKENFPKIIHQYSRRKHGPYIAVNCAAIPEGTIDSELFGHEKGAFTGAISERKGYFGEANGGTIFLDEVGELPLSTQARLLRVLETGEFMRVGSSKVEKTDVRIVAATNIDFARAIEQGKFREDLFYRLSTIPIHISPLRERKADIILLFKKFAADFAEKYTMPSITLTEDARALISEYPWPGNVRQLKNITEQISIIEKDRDIDAETLAKYLPEAVTANKLPVLSASKDNENTFSNEKEILYQVIRDMKNEIAELKKTVNEITAGNIAIQQPAKTTALTYNYLPSPPQPVQQPVQVTEVHHIEPGNRRLDDVLKWRIVELIRNEQWSPRQIFGRLKKEGINVSHEAIYAIIRKDGSGEFASHCRHRMKYRRRASHRHETRATNIRNRVSIH